MHGVKRDRNQLSAELKAQRKEKEAKKLEVYKNVEDQFFSFRKSNVVTIEALDLTTHLLRMNPELYTSWNYRRKILQSIFDQADDEVSNQNREKKEQVGQKDFFASARIDQEPGPLSKPFVVKQSEKRQISLLEEELDLTIEVLRMHPKVYWIWNHRKWCLKKLPCQDESATAKWMQEIQMVNKMLEMDARNFHGWTYRRFILTHLAIPKDIPAEDTAAFPDSLKGPLPAALKAHQLELAEKELQYTLSKIESNFSNFSAWHHRSLLLVPIWTAREFDEAQQRKERDEEFELIRQAMFVDPEDQSVWTYHSWLIGLKPSADVLEREIASMRELLELEPESKWCMVSLTDYLSLLEKTSRETEQKKELKQEARTILERLVQVDPDRKERYQESIDTMV